jgi:hypothetical protein
MESNMLQPTAPPPPSNKDRSEVLAGGVAGKLDAEAKSVSGSPRPWAASWLAPVSPPLVAPLRRLIRPGGCCRMALFGAFR